MTCCLLPGTWAGAHTVVLRARRGARQALVFPCCKISDHPRPIPHNEPAKHGHPCQRIYRQQGCIRASVVPHSRSSNAAALPRALQQSASLPLYGQCTRGGTSFLVTPLVTPYCPRRHQGRFTRRRGGHLQGGRESGARRSQSRTTPCAKHGWHSMEQAYISGCRGSGSETARLLEPPTLSVCSHLTNRENGPLGSPQPPRGRARASPPPPPPWPRKVTPSRGARPQWPPRPAAQTRYPRCSPPTAPGCTPKTSWSGPRRWCRCPRRR